MIIPGLTDEDFAKRYRWKTERIFELEAENERLRKEREEMRKAIKQLDRLRKLAQVACPAQLQQIIDAALTEPT